ncbi:MAG: hypothetical protein IJD42_02230 [Clostridia bacterium]|nr:hypothetical protein [Clostridia bacterium]
MKKSKIVDLVIFSMLGALLFVADIAFDFLPNIHPLAMLIVVYTLVYRARALIPIYIYVVILGVFNGFSLWWIPYIYIWIFIWLFAMLIPKGASFKLKGIISTVACGLHGILFGILYAPSQALLFGLDFQGMIAWIIAGLPWDVVHMCGNVACSLLVIPLYKLLLRLEEKRTI